MVNEKKDVIPAVIPTALRRPQSSLSNPTQPASPSETSHDLPTQHQSTTTPSAQSDLIYEIKGQGSQFVELQLKPGQSITGEINALMYYDNGISMKMRMSHAVESEGTGIAGFFSKILGIGKAAAKRQKLFIMTFTNTTQKPLKIAFSMPYPGTIVPIDLNLTGYRILCQDTVFLCATSDLNIGAATPKDVGANFLNSALTMRKIEGRGIVFLFCGGSLLQKNIVQGSPVNVAAGTTLALQPGVSLKVKTVRNVSLTGQGHMLTELGGTGMVWLQSMPYNRLADNIIEKVGIFFNIKQKKKHPLLGK